MSNEAPADALRLATRFHETYERLAPSFGYETRQDTKKFDPETPNGRLMVAVCAELAAAPASPLPGGGLPADVVRLVIAARRVAYEGAAENDLRALDIAAEAFASRVPWDDEPDEIPAARTGEPK